MLSQVFPETVPGDMWHIQRPVAMRIGDEAIRFKQRQGVWEKNWMPFLYSNELFISYQTAPRHLVYRHSAPAKPLHLEYVTTSAVVTKALPEKNMHGGPPLLLITNQVTTFKSSYYLGIIHYREVTKDEGLQMPHFAVRMSALPPFEVLQISNKEIPLQPVPGNRQRFGVISGAWLDEVTKQLVLTYGASDTSSRLLQVNVAEFENTFFSTI
jgi:hypothetical protein